MPQTPVAVLPLLALLGAAAPALADADDDAALTAFRAAFPDACLGAFDEAGRPTEPPQRFDVQMPVTWGDPEPVVLWQFHCDAGAYNLIHVFLLRTKFEGIRPLPLARPEVEAVYADPDDEASAVTEVKVLGWAADTTVMNASFDPATGQVSAYGLWRGLGDAYSAGTWVLKNGGLVLVGYEVDASFDGQSVPQLTLHFP
ncbi:DUF1176 domain-containing protein [Rhodobacter sp. Har01]|uniref:DUF1176 domain-containing protein n=1 Tax=Rhodobacter sp. Har01 TaxID=2883999 RepID=UPI001D067106|nr:DUF1176 domain-containing protein [Rhodobacter sp. Har01]MCB6178961.1 DUF1176 domain-containing protein [Rhodobacter sp. Har01]